MAGCLALLVLGGLELLSIRIELQMTAQSRLSVAEVGDGICSSKLMRLGFCRLSRWHVVWRLEKRRYVCQSGDQLQLLVAPIKKATLATKDV